MPSRRNQNKSTQRIRWHPQTEVLLLCIHRTNGTQTQNDSWHFNLPRLPPELWEMILTHPRYSTTPHSIFGITAPLLTRSVGGQPPHLLERYDKGWDILPERTQNRWSVFGRLGLFLHMMDNRVQIKDCTALDRYRPLPDWPTLQLIDAGQEAANIAVRRRLQPHFLSPDMENAASSAISKTIDDSDAWRSTAMVYVDPVSSTGVSIIARRDIDSADTRAVRSQHRRQTSRRLDNDAQVEQLAQTLTLKPPLGLHIREGYTPPMLRHLAAKGLCAPDNQPPATLTTSKAIIKHIFSQP